MGTHAAHDRCLTDRPELALEWYECQNESGTRPVRVQERRPDAPCSPSPRGRGNGSSTLVSGPEMSVKLPSPSRLLAPHAARPGPPKGTGPRRAENSGAADCVGLRTLLALDDLEGHPLALVEALVPVHLDGRVVDEDVLAAVDGDEAEALLGVEPLHGALCHVCSHVSCVRSPHRC